MAVGRRISGELSLANRRIKGVADGTAPSDAASVGQLTEGWVSETKQVVAGAGLLGGGNFAGADPVLDIGATDASIAVSPDGIAVGVLQSDAQHGTRGGGTLHALADGSTNGFMSAVAYGLLVATAGLIAQWAVGTTRYFMVDGVNGDDLNIGYADGAPNAALAKKTIAGMKAVLPLYLAGRSATVIIARGTYAENLDVMLTGLSVTVRGTATEPTAGSVAFANDAADKVFCGAEIAAGTESAGYTVSGSLAASGFDALKVSGGGSPAWTVNSLAKYRVRFSSTTTTVALRNACRSILLNAAGNITLANNMPATPVVGDVFYIEQQGVVVQRVAAAFNGPGFGVDANDGLQIVGIRTSNNAVGAFTVDSSAGDVKLIFSSVPGASAGFTATNVVRFELNHLWRDEAGTIVTSGGCYFGGSSSVLRCLNVSLSQFFHDSSFFVTSVVSLTLSSGGGKGTMTITGTGAGIGGTSSGNGTIIGNNGSATSRRYTLLAGGGLVLNGTSAWVQGVDVSGVGANPGITAGGTGVGLAFNDCVGTAGTGPGIDLQGCRGSEITMGQAAANTITGTAGDVRIGGAVIKTHAEINTSDVVDQNNTHIQGSGVTKLTRRTATTLGNMAAATADPASPIDGDFWFLNSGGVLQFCRREGGVTKRVTLS